MRFSWYIRISQSHVSCDVYTLPDKRCNSHSKSVRLSLRPSLCLNNEARIIRLSPKDGPATLVFCEISCSQMLLREHPKRVVKLEWSRINCDFRPLRSRLGLLLALITNRKSHTAFNFFYKSWSPCMTLNRKWHYTQSGFPGVGLRCEWTCRVHGCGCDEL